MQKRVKHMQPHNLFNTVQFKLDTIMTANDHARRCEQRLSLKAQCVLPWQHHRDLHLFNAVVRNNRRCTQSPRELKAHS